MCNRLHYGEKWKLYLIKILHRNVLISCVFSRRVNPSPKNVYSDEFYDEMDLHLNPKTQ